MGEMRAGRSVGRRGLGRRGLAGVAVAGAALLAVGALLSPATAAGRSAARPLGLFQPVAGESIPLHGGTVDSLNWSGYVVTPSAPVTNVSSTFTVPTAGLLPPGFTATWTGIGGYTSGSTDLIQAGVGEQSLPSTPLLGPQYYAWIETLPNPEQPIQGCSGDPNCTVNPGDVVSVTINNTSGNAWTISMSDSGHWSYSKSLNYQSSRSSAEWILEAPTLAVVQTIPAPVGTAHFGPTSTFNGGQTIASGNPTTIDMGPGVGLNEATPSVLSSSGEAFNVCTYASSCPAT